VTGAADPGSGTGRDSGAHALRPTGHDRVDAVLARAAELDTADIAEHPRLYEELHAALASELDAEPGTVPADVVRRPDPGP
jgi:hypothetical protein